MQHPFRFRQVERKGGDVDIEHFAGFIDHAISGERVHGRADLAAKESAEITTLSGYLPAQLDAAELDGLIQAAIGETGATSVKDMGKVMAELKAKYAGQMDMSKAGAIVKALLTTRRTTM